MQREFITKTYYSTNQNIYETVQIINETYPNHHIPEERKTPTDASLKQESFPGLSAIPKSKMPQGVWSQYNNNFFLDGNNLDAVNKLNRVLSCFPAVDAEIVKEIFYTYGDDYGESVKALKDIYPENYRKPPADPGPIRISSSSPVRIRQTGSVERISYLPPLRDDQYFEKLEIANRCRKLSEAYFQGASRVAAVGNMKEAKRLSDDGKRYQAEFEAAYYETYMETLRRNNNRPEVLDLHGLRVKEALEIVERFLNQSRQDGIRRVEIVTGRGMHSHKNIAKIKPAVGDYLKERGIKATELDGGFMVLLN